MYNYYQNPYQKPIGLKGRPVASIDEVKAAAIEFDGTISYFPDITNNKIYTKQINLDGTMSLNTYELIKNPIEEQNNYVTKEELAQALEKITNAKIATSF